MKAFVSWLFSQNNSDLTIGLFDIWHFLYLFVIFGGTALLSVLVKDKAKQEKTLRLFAYLTIGIYIADFFIMPLSDSYNGIGIDKLPYHVCTFMSVLAAFAQFNPRFKPMKSAIVSLSVTSALMWMCYPGSALGGQPPFCYIIFQTFMFHGLLFCWGVLNLSYGEVKLEFKKIWKEFCIIMVILVWAAFGNAVYENQNWFFIKESIFAFLPNNVLVPVVVFCVFGSCVVVYGAYYGIRAIAKRKQPV